MEKKYKKTAGRFRTFLGNKIGPRHFVAEKNDLPLLYSALIKKNSYAKLINSFAFNGNSLHWEIDCIFALPLRLSVNRYYKQVISAQSQYNIVLL